MLKATLLVFLCMVGACLGQHTTQSHEMQQFLQQIHTMVEQLFHRADRNGDGQFDINDLGNVFADYDANHDGMISRSEFVSRFTVNSSDPYMLPVAAGLFIDLDMNKDGNVEQSDVQLYFDKLDQDDDGRVERQEFVNYFTQLFEVLIIIAIRSTFSTTAAP